MAFSRDSNLILTVSGKVVRLWDATTQVPVGQPLEHRARAEEAAFGLDGTIVATRSAGVARLWDVATGYPIGPFFGQHGVTVPKKYSREYVLMAFSPDGEKFAIASDKTAQIWKLPTPMGGEPERLALWTQVIAGMEIDEQRAVHILDAKTSHERRRSLEKGSQPIP